MYKQNEQQVTADCQFIVSAKTPLPKMKIATWNIERLKKKQNLTGVVQQIEKINADILILTEFNKLVELPFYSFGLETQVLPQMPYHYAATERRVAIFSKFPIIQVFETYDSQTSCCAELNTPLGRLIVYGTIVGIKGNTDKNFNTDLENQINDINKWVALGNFCYSGDLNMSFFDNYYFTKKGRERFITCFEANNLINTTKDLPENIDHIIISERFANLRNLNISEWNTDKTLSDHKGVCIDLPI